MHFRPGPKKQIDEARRWSNLTDIGFIQQGPAVPCAASRLSLLGKKRRMQSTNQGQGVTGRRYNALPPFSSFVGKALHEKVCGSGSGLPKRDRHLFGLSAEMEKSTKQNRESSILKSCCRKMLLMLTEIVAHCGTPSRKRKHSGTRSLQGVSSWRCPWKCQPINTLK